MASVNKLTYARHFVESFFWGREGGCNTIILHKICYFQGICWFFFPFSIDALNVQNSIVRQRSAAQRILNTKIK